MTKLFTVLSLLFSTAVVAQDITTTSLRWTCNQTTDLKAPSTKDYACVFITQGNRTITWLQRSGQVRSTYVIREIQGSWRDITSQGIITYLVDRDGRAGRVVVERSGESINITVDFSESGQHNIKQRFRVSEVAIEP